MIVLYAVLCVISLLYLRKVGIKNTYMVRTGFEKDNTPFASKFLMIFLFISTMLMFFLVIHELLDLLGKTQGGFAAYTYLILTVIYFVFIINFTSKKNHN